MLESLNDLFALSVERYPALFAASDGTQRVTYERLAHRAAMVAAGLTERGATVEEPVAVRLERSVDLLAVVLGVLQAGCTYVLIDATYPTDRRAVMIAASGARLLVTESEWTGDDVGLELSVISKRDLFRGDADGIGLGPLGPPPAPGTTGADEAPGADISLASRAACILFTSGSTGTPKATVLEHGNLVWFATNSSLPELHAGERVGQMSSVSFDAFHIEMWCSLAQGAEVVVLPPLQQLLAEDLRYGLTRRSISVLFVPSMALNHVVREDRDAFSSLRLLYTGGDVLAPATCKALVSGTFSGRLVTLYGPTEATTACMGHEVDGADGESLSVPLGQELDAARVHILDGHRLPVRGDELGEIFITGAGVARGYLGDPDLTLDRFPLIDVDGVQQRAYATGDLGRRYDDGRVEFMGRADRQVKVRGYRVEPTEVEQLLGRHGAVAEAVVLPDGRGQDLSLVALVVCDDTLSMRELRTYAEALMMSHMVPAALLRVAAIPLTDNGKRDYRRMEGYARAELARMATSTPPATKTEVYLASVWQDLLGCEHVGAMDDFFELGGNSMLAFRLYQRLKRDRPVAPEFAQMMTSLVLARLAKLLDSLAASSGGGDGVSQTAMSDENA